MCVSTADDASTRDGRGRAGQPEGPGMGHRAVILLPYWCVQDKDWRVLATHGLCTPQVVRRLRGSSLYEAASPRPQVQPLRYASDCSVVSLWPPSAPRDAAPSNWSPARSPACELWSPVAEPVPEPREHDPGSPHHRRSKAVCALVQHRGQRMRDPVLKGAQPQKLAGLGSYRRTSGGGGGGGPGVGVE